MERSRSKRNYYYDQDYDSETMGGRRRPRYNHHYTSNNHRYRVGSSGSGGGGGGGRPSKTQDSSVMVTTSYRILCHDMKAGGVIGKSGSIIKSIRQHTGAWINVHELIPGDEERIIEISDTRRRDPDGRMPSFSPAQEALLLIHERILESDSGFVGEEEDEYGGRGGGGGSSHHRVATRLVVSRMHVGCLLGKGGKIIEQMRMETKTQIRILPRDHNLPRCVSMSEEIVQVLGDVTAVKNAIAVISSRLRESQHRDRSQFHGRLHSPDRSFPDEDYIPHVNNAGRRSSIDGPAFGSRLSATNMRNSNYHSRSSSFPFEAGEAPMMDDGQHFYGEDIVFRMLCPIVKVDRIVGDSDGIVELLQNEIGVVVKVTEPVVGSDEQIITISSEEGPDDELFPAQEALLHIQTRIVDLVPDKDNIVTTRLLITSNDVECLDGKDTSLLELSRLTGTTIQIVPREELPVCVTKTDELVQIVGEIKAAREALVEVTSRLRNFLYREFFQKDTTPLADPTPELGVSSPNNVLPVREGQVVSGSNTAYQNVHNVSTAPPSNETGGLSTETAKQSECDRRDEVLTGLSRIAVPLVTRSILEVVLPDYAAPKLTRNKLLHISEFSGAKVTLVDDGSEVTEKVIQISGTPEQAQKAQSLLQGFILSTQDDGP